MPKKKRLQFHHVYGACLSRSYQSNKQVFFILITLNMLFIKLKMPNDRYDLKVKRNFR